jgi:hypothetical protein
VTEDQKRKRKEKRGALLFSLLLAALLIIPLAAGACGLVVVRNIARSNRPRRPYCRNNLRQVGLACHMYADDNDERFPQSVSQLFPDYLDNVRVLHCPSARSRNVPGPHYVYVPGLRSASPPEYVLAYENAGNHPGEGFTVLFVDAHVEWWESHREGELEALIAEQKFEMAEKAKMAGKAGAAKR